MPLAARTYTALQTAGGPGGGVSQDLIGRLLGNPSIDCEHGMIPLHEGSPILRCTRLYTSYMPACCSSSIASSCICMSAQLSSTQCSGRDQT